MKVDSLLGSSLLLHFCVVLGAGSGDAPVKDCVDWDLTSVDVPQSVVFRARIKDHMVGFDAKPEDVWSYWNRIEAATKAADTQGLHKALKLHGKMTNVLVDVMGAKRAACKEASGTTAKPGVFIYLRGDSHMRITLNMMMLITTHNKTTNKKAAYNKMTYHHSHLFCCEKPSGSPPWEHCDLEIAVTSKEAHSWEKMRSAATMIVEDDKHSLIARRLERGDVCILWDMVELFARDFGVLDKMLSDDIVPDLIVADGGAHYHDYVKAVEPDTPLYIESMASFKTDVQKWIAAAASVVGTQPASSLTTLVLVSSPFSSYSKWGSQLRAYEDMREAVAALPPAARRRTSYLDLHSLWAVDKCGFSTKFPSKSYRWIDAANKLNTTNECGHHLVNSDPHLMGGAYLHSAELCMQLLWSQLKNGQRRCDPPPHVPSVTFIDDLDFSKKTKEGVLRIFAH